jgi:hypothetical protein
MVRGEFHFWFRLGWFSTINNLIIKYNNISNEYNNTLQIEYSLFRLSLFWALALDLLNKKNMVHIAHMNNFSLLLKSGLKCIHALYAKKSYPKKEFNGMKPFPSVRSSLSLNFSVAC